MDINDKPAEHDPNGDGDGYTPAQLARISGVSVRTLHHYDQIGLLVPARQSNGYRVYRGADVDRLQKILIYRGLGVDLAAIGELLQAGHGEQANAMRRHLGNLQRRRREMDLLIATVEQTIDQLEGHPIMKNGNSSKNSDAAKGANRNANKDAKKFEALKQQAVDENERAYGEEVRAKYGDKTVDAANAKLLRMGQREWSDVNQLGEDILAQLSSAMETGDATGEAARRLVDMHRSWLCAWWPDGMYSVQAHRNMADMYIADPRFTAYYDEPCGKGATQFLHDAIYACA